MTVMQPVLDHVSLHHRQRQRFVVGPTASQFECDVRDVNQGDLQAALGEPERVAPCSAREVERASFAG